MYFDEKGRLKDEIDLENSKNVSMFVEADKKIYKNLDIGGTQTDRMIEKKAEVEYRYWLKTLKVRVFVLVFIFLLLFFLVSLSSCARTTTLRVRGAQIDSLDYQHEIVIRNR